MVAGPSRITPAVCAEFSPKELTKCKVNTLLWFILVVVLLGKVVNLVRMC